MTFFQDVLGDTFSTLHEPLQDLHSLEHKVWRGQAHVQTGRNPLAKIAAFIIGLRIKSGETPLTVTLTPKKNGELWQRNFNGTIFRSRFTHGTGRNAGLAIESFGAISIAINLSYDNGRLYFIPEHCTLLGITIPRFLRPKGESYETEIDGKFHFNVEIKLPLLGLIAAYKGWLEPSHI